MDLADKPCYPPSIEKIEDTLVVENGITFRERLIISLAGNPVLYSDPFLVRTNADRIIKQADAIIEHMKNENRR